jgi:hypothetical protein
MDISKDIQNIQNRNINNVKNDFSAFKDNLLKLDTQNNLINSVNNFKNRNQQKNKAQILSLRNDLNTVRRQIEIAENDSLIKNDFINILQFVFLYLGIIFLILFGLTGSEYAMPLIHILSIFFGWIFLKKVYNLMNRNKNRWTIFQFNAKIK